MIVEPKDPAQIRTDVDSVFDHAGSYKSFGELLGALLEANNETLKGLHRKTGIGRSTLKRWRDDGVIPSKEPAEELMLGNPLNFRTDASGKIDQAQHDAFMHAAQQHMSGDEVKTAVKDVLAHEADYPAFPKFLAALYNANRRMPDDEAAGLFGFGRKYISGLRTGEFPPSREFIVRMTSDEPNPFNLPVVEQGGRLVVDQAAKDIVYGKAGLVEIKPEELRQNALSKLENHKYRQAGDFFKDSIGHIPYPQIARQMNEIMPPQKSAPKVNSDRVSLMLNGHRNIHEREADAMMRIAQIEPGSPEEKAVRQLEFGRQKPTHAVAPTLRAMMRDFNDGIGMQPGELYHAAANMAGKGNEPFSYHTLQAMLGPNNAPQKPRMRSVRYIAKVMDQGLPEKRVDEWIAMTGYTRKELFQNPHDVVADLDKYPDMTATIRALRQTEEVNFNTVRMAEILEIGKTHYSEFEQKHLTPDVVSIFLEEFNKEMTAKRHKPLSEEERALVMEKANAEYEARQQAIKDKPIQSPYFSRDHNAPRRR